MLIHLKRTISYNTYSGFVVRTTAWCGAGPNETIAVSNIPSDVTCFECREHLENRKQNTDNNEN